MKLYFTVTKDRAGNLGVNSFMGRNAKEERRNGEGLGYIVIGVYATMADARIILDRERIKERLGNAN